MFDHVARLVALPCVLTGGAMRLATAIPLNLVFRGRGTFFLLSLPLQEAVKSYSLPYYSETRRAPTEALSPNFKHGSA